MLYAQARQLAKIQCLDLEVVRFSSFEQVDELFGQLSLSSVTVRAI